MKNNKKLLQILYTIFFSVFAFFGMVREGGSLFFIIYLFWMEALINTITLWIIAKYFNKNHSGNAIDFVAIKQIVRGRLFMLSAYFVFIVLVFGIVFYLVQVDSKKLIENVSIITFRNLSFNICIFITIVKAGMNYRAYRNKISDTTKINLADASIITLHLSIIFGAFVWFFVSGKFFGMQPFNLGAYQEYVVGIPFFLIRLIIGIYNAQKIETGSAE